MRAKVADAIHLVRNRIRWKPGSAAIHLQKRRRRGHLSPEATLTDYERIILSAVSDPIATVYLYVYGSDAYVAVVSVLQRQTWLTMFAQDGLLESAYIVERPELYLSNSAFDRMGTLDEVLS